MSNLSCSRIRSCRNRSALSQRNLRCTSHLALECTVSDLVVLFDYRMFQEHTGTRIASWCQWGSSALEGTRLLSSSSFQEDRRILRGTRCTRRSQPDPSMNLLDMGEDGTCLPGRTNQQDTCRRQLPNPRRCQHQRAEWERSSGACRSSLESTGPTVPSSPWNCKTYQPHTVSIAAQNRVPARSSTFREDTGSARTCRVGKRSLLDTDALHCASSFQMRLPNHSGKRNLEHTVQLGLSFPHLCSRIQGRRRRTVTSSPVSSTSCMNRSDMVSRSLLYLEGSSFQPDNRSIDR